MPLPAVLVVSSHVVRGSVGSRSAFVLERLGHRVWTLPTIILPWHPGHGLAHRIVPSEADFAALAADVGRAPWLKEIGAVVSGYLANAAQAEAVTAIVDAVKAANPEALYLCDPIIGDDPGLYVREEVAHAQRELLMPRADLATPNRFELAWMTGRPLDDMAAVVEAARALGRPKVVVTSAPAMMRGQIATAVVTPTETVVAETRRLEGFHSGTGDLFCALFLSRTLAGQSDEQALAAAVGGTFEVVARSSAAGSDELDLAFNQDSLVRPAALVNVRRYGPPPDRRKPAPRPDTAEE